MSLERTQLLGIGMKTAKGSCASSLTMTPNAELSCIPVESMFISQERKRAHATDLLGSNTILNFVGIYYERNLNSESSEGKDGFCRGFDAPN